MKRRTLMATLLNSIAILFRGIAWAEQPPFEDANALSARVRDVCRQDSGEKGTATLVLSVMPRETRFDLEGDVRGMNEGDFIRFHIVKNAIVWKNREIHIAKGEFQP